jgi:hypothetical protein
MSLTLKRKGKKAKGIFSDLENKLREQKEETKKLKRELEKSKKEFRKRADNALLKRRTSTRTKRKPQRYGLS